MVVLLALSAFAGDVPETTPDVTTMECDVTDGGCLAAPPAAAPEDTRIARWSTVRRGDPVRGPDGRLWRWVAWGGGPPLKLSCEQRPTLMGMVRGVYVTSHHTAKADAHTWIVPPAPKAAPWNGWLVHPATCDVQRLRTHATAWSWALAERTPSLGPWEELLAGKELWSWASKEPLRQVAVRLPGPHPVSWRTIHAGEQVSLDDEPWSVLAKDASVAIDGPARVVVHVRSIGVTDEACIVVDGERTCRSSSPSRGVQIRDEKLFVELRTMGDDAIHRFNRFRVALGPGEHRLAMGQRSLARIAHHRHEPWNGAPELPKGSAVTPQRANVDWQTAPNEGGTGVWLMGPAPRPILEDAPHWAPLDNVPPGAHPPTSDRIDLWLQPDSADSTCFVQLGDLQAASIAPRGVHRFSWVGPSEAPAIMPSVDGCAAWVRVQGSMSADGRSLSWHQLLHTGERLVATTVADREARLEVAVPLDPGEVTVTATAPGGLTRSWTLIAGEHAPQRITADGELWTDPVPLPLPIGSSSWAIDVQGVATVRVRQPVVIEDLVDNIVIDSIIESDNTSNGAASGTVRQASRRVANATTDVQRVRALMDRAQLLLAEGQSSLASADLVLAERIDPHARALAEHRTEILRAERERSLFGVDRWIPLDRRWVALPMVPPDAKELTLVHAASRGDALTVALGVTGDEAVRWWRRALHGGQIATEPQRLRAFQTALRARQPQHPAVAVLRSLTRWEPVVWLSGPRVRQTVVWPAFTRPHDALFPDAWPASEIVPVGKDWKVRVPSRTTSLALPIRCRTTSVPSLEPCIVEAHDGDRRLIASARVRPWGSPGELVVPKGQVAYISLRTRNGHTAQLRWMRGTAPGTLREAWRATPNVPVVAHVLGPTVLRVQTMQSGHPQVTIDDEPQVGYVAEDGSWQVSIDRAGPVSIHIVVPQTTWLRVATRRPISGGPEPAMDRLQEPIAPTVPQGDPVEEPVEPPIPVAMPVSAPRAWTADATLGSAENPSAESHTTGSAPLALTARGGIDSRVNERVWTDARLGAQARSDGAVLAVGDVGADVVIRPGASRVYAIGDLHLAAGAFGGTGLGTARANVAIHLAQDLGASWQMHARFRGTARLRTPLDTARLYPRNRSLLWSRYAEQHRAQLHGLLSVRWRSGPWWALRGELRATSNTPGARQPIDLIGADMIIDASRPDVRLRLRAGVELRLADAHREEPHTSLLLDGRIKRMIWRTPSYSIAPWASVRLRPLEASASAMVGVQTRWGGPRGLKDVRPSRIAERHASEWGFWREALEAWPVTVEAPDDANSPPATATEAL